MLQTIREHTQGWIAGTIISVIILSFAFWGIHSYFVTNANTSIIAEVNGIDITREQLTVAYERIRRQAQTQYGANNPITTKDEAVLKSRALQALISIEVLKQASLDQGFNLSNNQVDNYVEGMPEFQIDGVFSVDRFNEVLSSTMLNTGEFLELIKTSLLIDQPKLGIVFTSFALPEETSYTISLINQERDIDYLTLSSQTFLAQQAPISPQQILAYYKQHQNEFMTPEQVSVEYIELGLKDLSARFHPTETMLKSFYNENINSYTLPMAWKLNGIEVKFPANATNDDVAQVKKKIEDIHAKLRQGGDFNALSHENTSTMNTRNWVTLTDVPEAIQKSLASLVKVGQISEPIQTETGFVIIKAADVREPKIQTFEIVKDNVKDAYVRQHAEEKFAELREQLSDLTYEHPDTLMFAGKTLSVPVKSSDLFTRDKGNSVISQNKKVREVAFSNDVLNLQNNSDVIQLNPETLIVIRIKSHIASTLLPLNSVTSQIENKLKVEEAEKRTAALANNILVKLQAGENPLAAINKAPNWNKVGFIGRYSTKVDSAILDAAYRLPNPQNSKNKVVYGMTRIPNGYAIVALRSVRDGTVSDKKQFTVFAEQAQNSEGLLEYELYKQSQMERAKIKINQQE